MNKAIQYSRLDGMQYETVEEYHKLETWQAVVIGIAVVFMAGKVLQLW